MHEQVIACTLYRRPVQTRQILDAFASCYGITDYRILFTCDYSDTYAEACEEVIALAESFSACESRVFVHRQKLGIDCAKLFVLDEAFNLTTMAICFEDDCLPSPDCLRYFEQAGERFRNDPRVVTISGYNRAGSPACNLLPYQLGFKPTFVPWGWSIHKDRWEVLFAGGSGGALQPGARYIAETGEGVNNSLDTWMCSQLAPGEGMVYPMLSRINLVGAEDATHPHSKEYYNRFERNEDSWAGRINLPEPTPELWGL